jgi:hypothetical protein
MTGPAALVRDLIPRERISTARIRQAVNGEHDLGCWSRNTHGAIRPGLLAELIRDCLWEHLDVPLAEVRAKIDSLERGSIVYHLILEVETDRGRCLEVEADIRFFSCASHRIAAEIGLNWAGTSVPLHAGRILLTAP